MLVSYTVAAPIWKTTYRVVLDDAGRPFFQGWAIVDNVSEEDWTDVQLSLISGTPVSFIQPIQKPFYRYRPVVPMPADLSLSPQVYEPESGEAAAGAPNTLAGSVEDPSGAAVPSATVTVTNDATGQQYTTMTDDEGTFRTPPLPAGVYTVTVGHSGFNTANVTGVSVGPGRAASIGVTLDAAGVTETVNVTAAGLPAARPRTNNLSNLPINGRRGDNFLTDGAAAQEFGARSATSSSTASSSRSPSAATAPRSSPSSRRGWRARASPSTTSRRGAAARCRGCC